MFGLSVFIGTFISTKATVKDAPKPDWKDEGKALLFNVFGWLIALGIGYAIHTWFLR
jgi:preprotein translocase subunit Sss1